MRLAEAGCVATFRNVVGLVNEVDSELDEDDDADDDTEDDNGDVDVGARTGPPKGFPSGSLLIVVDVATLVFSPTLAPAIVVPAAPSPSTTPIPSSPFSPVSPVSPLPASLTLFPPPATAVEVWN